MTIESDQKTTSTSDTPSGGVPQPVTVPSPRPGYAPGIASWSVPPVPPSSSTAPPPSPPSAPVYPAPPAAATSVGWGRFWAGCGVGAVVALLLVLAIGNRPAAGGPSGATSSPVLSTSYTLQGSITLAPTSSFGSSNYRASSGGCQGTSGYSDMTAGTDVNVYDTRGSIVALGRLGAGQVTSQGCVFSFSVPGVPNDGGVVQVEVSHRGRLSLSAAEAMSGEAAFTLGTN